MHQPFREGRSSACTGPGASWSPESEGTLTHLWAMGVPEHREDWTVQAVPGESRQALALSGIGQANPAGQEVTCVKPQPPSYRAPASSDATRDRSHVGIRDGGIGPSAAHEIGTASGHT